MTKKQDLGQFYTTNAAYIIGNLIQYLPKGCSIVDPFVGNGDLLTLLPKSHPQIGYDLDPQNQHTIKQDTLTNPPDYHGKWIVTNPPYLAKNKNTLPSNHKLFETYQTNDLYKVALKTFSSCLGGVLVLPLNFFCEVHSAMREEFLGQFAVRHLNIFEEQVFDDTSYTTCSFWFERAPKPLTHQEIEATFYPKKTQLTLTTTRDFNFRLGYEFYRELATVVSPITVSRLLDREPTTSKLKLRAIDTGRQEGRIKLEFCPEPYFDLTPKKSERTFATLKTSVDFSDEEQRLLIREFNSHLEAQRELYHSLFLTNFRNSTDSYARKRISFETAYQLLSYVIEKNRTKLPSLN